MRGNRDARDTQEGRRKASQPLHDLARDCLHVRLSLGAAMDAMTTSALRNKRLELCTVGAGRFCRPLPVPSAPLPSLLPTNALLVPHRSRSGRPRPPRNRIRMRMSRSEPAPARARPADRPSRLRVSQLMRLLARVLLRDGRQARNRTAARERRRRRWGRGQPARDLRGLRRGVAVWRCVVLLQWRRGRVLGAPLLLRRRRCLAVWVVVMREEHLARCARAAAAQRRGDLRRVVAARVVRRLSLSGCQRVPRSSPGRRRRHVPKARRRRVAVEGRLAPAVRREPGVERSATRVLREHGWGRQLVKIGRAGEGRRGADLDGRVEGWRRWEGRDGLLERGRRRSVAIQRVRRERHASRRRRRVRRVEVGREGQGRRQRGKALHRMGLPVVVDRRRGSRALVCRRQRGRVGRVGGLRRRVRCKD